MACKEQCVWANRAKFLLVNLYIFICFHLVGWIILLFNNRANQYIHIYAPFLVYFFYYEKLGIHWVKASILEEFDIYLLTCDLFGFGESDPYPNRILYSLALDMLFLVYAMDIKDKFWVVRYSSGAYMFGRMNFLLMHYIFIIYGSFM